MKKGIKVQLKTAFKCLLGFFLNYCDYQKVLGLW